LIGSDNMRDVVAFPKTQRGQDLLLEAPSVVTPEQLEELSIRIRAPRKQDPSNQD
jgi:aspartyl-tRNA synthetase